MIEILFLTKTNTSLTKDRTGLLLKKKQSNFYKIHTEKLSAQKGMLFHEYQRGSLASA